MTKKEEIKVILNELNEQLGTTLHLESRNGYYAIDNILPSTGTITLASGMTLNESYMYARGMRNFAELMK